MNGTFPYLWLIPFFPLLGSVIIRFLGKRLLSRQQVHYLACGTVFGSFLIGVWAFATLIGTSDHVLRNDLYTWVEVGRFRVGTSFLFDTLSAVMTMVVTGVGFLIHVYSTGYMGHDKEFERYFAYLNLFTAMMLILVLGDNLLLMFVGWEGVGLCSYLLIGFWFNEKANADAGKKAFIVNRIGDFGFILGMLTLFWTLGMAKDIWSLDFAALRTNADVFTSVAVFGIPAVTFATLMLFVGASGKSAQIPLYVWLPDAMAGPTPVSALIHAATMVTAGVYMIARLSFLYDLAPFTLNVVATIGGLTALYAATIGLLQNDIKKVLAYSTVSQLGYMFLACGVGAYASGIFHLMTHAFFKGLLFLGAGSVIHAMSNEQDMRKMGGLKYMIPGTYWTFAVATVAIAGFPPFAGFFSKDEILWQAWNKNKLFWALGAMAAVLTSFYMFRLLYMTFFGESRAEAEVKKHIHESPPSMLVPLMILAVLSAIGGFVWVPHLVEVFPHWLESSVVVHHPSGSFATELTLMAVSVGIAVAGWRAAHYFYRAHPDRAQQWSLKWHRTYKLLLNKYWVDELYESTFIRGTKKLAAIAFSFDKWVVDGLVNGTGWMLRILSFIDGLFDTIVVDGLVNLIGGVTLTIGRRVRRLQTGQIQLYLGALAGLLVIFSLLWMSFLVGP